MRMEEHSIRRAMRRAGFRPDVIGYQAPYNSVFLHSSEFRAKFYDCIDEWSLFSGVNALLVRRIEDEILANVDVVFATAKALLAAKSRLNSNCHYLPNALGEQFLHGLPSYGPLGCFDGLTLGYLGSLNCDCFDFELIQNLLKNQTLAGRPFRIVLVGPVMDDSSKARSLELACNKRLVLTGAVPYDAVPAYLGSFDFCILPWRPTELVRYVDPIKIYEYLSSGAPVITTRWPEVEIYEDVLYFAGTASGYRLAVETECRKSVAQRKAEGLRRRELVRAHTWAARATTLLAVLDDV
jgi:glycosyltransferase involved in cell wall biosynthesis